MVHFGLFYTRTQVCIVMHLLYVIAYMRVNEVLFLLNRAALFRGRERNDVLVKIT